MAKGIVFDIQKFALHDGSRINTVIFFGSFYKIS